MRKFPQSGMTMKIPGSTSNLGAGFDTFGLALQIYLTLKVKPAETLRVVLSGEGAEVLARDRSNLVVRTYLRACERFGLQNTPLALEIHNDIPLERGLGSSGAAIAAGLFLAAWQAGRNVPVKNLLELGCEIEGHPENLVASFLGGLSVNCYHSGALHHAHFASLPPLQAVLLIPEFTIATEQARRLLPQSVRFSDAVANVQRAGLLVAALLGGELSLLREAVKDRLHQPYRKKLIAGFDAILQAGYDAGALAVFLSGSGSTMLALTTDATTASRIENAMREVVATLDYRAQTKSIGLDFSGARVV